ncbi:MAG: hypothetical protein M3Y57_08700 [Acidobacteriota bacterium]|nr:hypothetical protein [Acidobacteriota bacterium]
MASFWCGSCCIALLSIGSLGFSNATADTISNSVGGNWSDAGTWTPAVVPNNTAGQSFDVSIGSTGGVTLNTNPTINSLTLAGPLSTGFYPPFGGTTPLGFTSLTVNGNVNVTASGTMGNASSAPFDDSLGVGGNLTNAGFLYMTRGLSVTGNMNNAGTLSVGYPDPSLSTMRGLLPYNATPFTSLGGLANSGTITFQGGTATIGTKGNTILNTGSLSVGALFNAPATITVPGDFSNSGSVVLGTNGAGFGSGPFGTSTLNVEGTFINQPTGTLTINNPKSPFYNGPSMGVLQAQTLVNYGTMTIPTYSPTTVGQLENGGTLNVFGDAPGGAGRLTVNTLKLNAGGAITVWNQGGVLTVGSGMAPAGFEGYYQSADGMLEYAGGSLLIQDPASLDGTLDIMLGDGYKPAGTIFDVLQADGTVTGVFSNVEGLVFDGGQEKYVLGYTGGYEVTLTVENNATPEPGSVFLVLLGFMGILAIGAARKRSRRYCAPSNLLGSACIEHVGTGNTGAFIWS